jgi:hypothetical protein
MKSNNDLNKTKHKKLLNNMSKPNIKQVATSNIIIDQLFDN